MGYPTKFQGLAITTDLNSEVCKSYFYQNFYLLWSIETFISVNLKITAGVNTFLSILICQ